MSRKNYARSQIFLMEFIVVVLFFALCASICISAFVKADNISKDSKELNHALILAQSAAESIKALDDDEFGRLTELVGLYKTDENTYFGYYTKKFKRCGEEMSAENAQKMPQVNYVMEVTTVVQDKMLTANIKVYNKETAADKICELEVKKYLPEEVKNAKRTSE